MPMQLSRQRVTLFSFFLLIAVTATPPAAAQDLQEVLEALEQSANQRVVSVSGEGEVQVEPDQATVRFGVVTRAPNPEAAREQNAEASKNALNAVRDLGVPERKIQLQTLRLHEYRERRGPRNEEEERGYEAMRIMVVELDDLELLPKLVAEVVQEGANRLEGVEYSLQDRTGARNEALRKALTDAREKATIMAETLDAERGRVLRIADEQISEPLSRSQFSMEMAKSADAAPEPEAYAAGELDVRAVVQVTFALQ